MCRILISALASNEIGTGHLRRMATLMTALERVGSPELRCYTTALGARILRELGWSDERVQIIVSPDAPGEAIADLRHRLSYVRPDVTILDNYFWNAGNEEALMPNCGMLCVVSDWAGTPHKAALLLDQNANSEAADYRGFVPDDCALMVGPEYCLVADAFIRMRRCEHVSAEKRAELRPVFLSLGGGDPKGDIYRLVKIVLRVTDRPVTIATGSHISDAHKLAALARSESRLDLRFDSTEVAQQMNRSAYALASGGTMTWERAVLGLPSLSLTVAENQREATAWLVTHGYQWSFDISHDWDDDSLADVLIRYDADASIRVAHSKKSLELITGDGADRFARSVLSRAFC